MRFTFAGFFLAYGLASLALARRILPDAWALVATILMLFQGYALVMSNLLFTEIPFVLISVCLILLIDGKEEKPSTWKKDGLAFLLATAGFALRSAGVVLLIAWPLAHLLHGRWRRSLITSLMAVIPVLLWQLHVKSVQQSREYQEPAYAYQRAPYQFYNVPYAENALLVDPFTPELGEINKLTLIKRMFSNALDIPLAFGESTCTVYGYCLWAIERTQDYFLGKVLVPGQAASKLLVVIGLSAFIGCLLVAWKHYYVLGLVVVGTAGLVCMTPWPGQFARYLVPIVPFVAIGHTTFIKESVFWILKLLGHPGGKGQLIAVPPFALVLLLQVYGITKIYASNELPGNSSDKWSESMFYYDKFWDNWQKASVWIVSDASPGDIVATISSHYFFLQTGMKAVYPPMEVDPEKARRLMEEVPIRYFIADETVHLDVARRYGLPAMESNPENWQLVFQIDETRVFKNTGIK
ncbi:MAG: hypothetical protein KJT03_04680, partial [Verrucomicrobiae bacterium]|nr:hypothetical protein [Verrucomicrobiae bacterium]